VHFNDFIHVSLLRSALHAALLRNKELSFDRVSEAVVAASGEIRDIAKTLNRSPASGGRRRVARVHGVDGIPHYETCGAVGVVQLNLENVRLLRVGYRGLEALVPTTLMRFHPSVATLTPAQRERPVRALLDSFAGSRHRLPLSGDQPAADAPAGGTEPERILGLDETARDAHRESVCPREPIPAPAEGFSLGERSKVGRFLKRTRPDPAVTHRARRPSGLLVGQGLLGG
jgi:hypothetical protein